MRATLPPVRPVRRGGTHRLVPAKFRWEDEGALPLLAEDASELADLRELARATDAGYLAEADRLPGIGVDELVFGISHARMINAAFCCAHPYGSRFNGPERGAWYASFDLATSIQEIVFHRGVLLAEINYFHETIDYDDWLADFRGDFHDLRNAPEFAACLDPQSYVHSQKLGRALLESGSAGIVYPSVRRQGGTCLACFRPALVQNVRSGVSRRFHWDGTASPEVTRL